MHLIGQPLYGMLVCSDHGLGADFTAGHRRIMRPNKKCHGGFDGLNMFAYSGQHLITELIEVIEGGPGESTSGFSNAWAVPCKRPRRLARTLAVQTTRTGCFHA